MVFGWFKKFGKKEPNYDEIKDTVLGEPIPEVRSEIREEPIERPLEPFNREELSLEPVGRGGVPPFEEKNYNEKNYEVIDRLKFIENQLSAIRSQLELVNERLKLIENKFRRGY